MKLNQAGVDLIKKFEGLRLEAYPDPATGAEPYTIGYGHTGKVRLSDVWTEEKALEVLHVDLANVSSNIGDLIHCVLSDNEFSALVSLVLNIGIGHFKTSTLLKKINAGDIEAAGKEFVRWDKADGKEMPGLLARRLAEQSLFRS